MEAAIGQLIRVFIGCFIWSLIGAVILRAAAKWIQKLDVGFGNAYVTVLPDSRLVRLISSAYSPATPGNPEFIFIVDEKSAERGHSRGRRDNEPVAF